MKLKKLDSVNFKALESNEMKNVTGGTAVHGEHTGGGNYPGHGHYHSDTHWYRGGTSLGRTYYF